MSTPFIKRYYRIPRHEIGYLRFILEGYDGLIFMRTLDPREALIEVAYSPSRRLDADALLLSLAVEVSLEEVPSPPPGSYSPL